MDDPIEWLVNRKKSDFGVTMVDGVRVIEMGAKISQTQLYRFELQQKKSEDILRLIQEELEKERIKEKLKQDFQKLLSHNNLAIASNLTKTGLPGRPSAKELIKVIFEERIQDNKILPVLSEEAREIQEVIKTRLPNGNTIPSTKVIENHIRMGYQKARKGNKNT